MIESYKQSVEEFKRIDHLFYVTLKYTRTVDVIRSTIERFISMYEAGIDAILKVMKDKKKIEDFPNNPVGKAELLKESCDAEILPNIERYLMFRKMMRLEYGKREEYRRHVTMIVQYEGQTLNVDIDLLQEYYDEARKFLTHVKQHVQEYREDD